MSNLINEEKVLEFIIHRREQMESPEDIRAALHKHMDFAIDEFLPLSDRVLESYYNALEIVRKAEKIS